MSALCQKQTFCTAAETALFDHFVGAGKYCRRNGEAEYFCGFKIDHQLVLAGRLCPLWVKSRHQLERTNVGASSFAIEARRNRANGKCKVPKVMSGAAPAARSSASSGI